MFLTLEIVLHRDPWPKEVVESPQAIFASLPEGSKVHACLTHCIHPEMMPCHTGVALASNPGPHHFDPSARPS